MTETNGRQPDNAEKLVRDIRRATRQRFSAVETIRIVLESLRGEYGRPRCRDRDGLHRQ